MGNGQNRKAKKAKKHGKCKMQNGKCKIENAKCENVKNEK